MSTPLFSRRAVLGYGGAALAGPMLLRAALAADGDAPADLAIVMNSGEATVSVIDMASRQVIRTLRTLREPSHWALTPDRSQLQIADAGGNALFTVDPRAGTAITHVRMPDPYQLGYTPDQKYLAVNCLRLNLIHIYNAADMSLALRLKAPSMPSHLDFSPDSQWSFHSMQGSDDLVSIDLATMTPRWRMPLGSTPAGVLWLNGKVLVCLMGTETLAEVDPLTGQVTRYIPVGIGPHNLFLTPARDILYVSNRVGGTLAALDPQTLTVQRTYDLHAGGPDDMGIAPDGKLWISLRFRSQVAVLDPVTGSYDTITVGNSPHGIFLNTELRNPAKVTSSAL